MVIVSGHRTTYGAPFWDLNRLRPGDEIVIEAKWGDFVYEVTETEVVDDDTPVHAPVGEPLILLTTCEPRYSAAERLLVRGELIEEAEA
jgi:sortase A